MKKEAKKKTAGKRGGSTILDTEAGELQRKEAEDRLRNADNPDTHMESSPVLAPPADVGSSMPNNPSIKRPRARPRGGNLTRMGGDFAETAKGKLITHVLEVPEGEDLYAILTSCFQKATGGLYISSVTGKVSDISLRPPRTQTHANCFEGTFQILSLNGSSKQNEASNPTPLVCNLSISVAREDGQVIGGVVAGPLIASTPIQVILSGFDEQHQKQKYKRSNDSQSNATKSKVPKHNTKATADGPRVTNDDGGNSKTTEDKEKCQIPATAVLGEGSKAGDEEAKYDTPTTPILAHDDYTESHSVNTENQTTPLCVSPISVIYRKDPMQVWQPPADEEVNYDTLLAHDDYAESHSVNSENQTTPLCVTPIRVVYSENQMEEWQPSDVEESFTSPMPASPNGVGQYSMSPSDQTTTSDAGESSE